MTELTCRYQGARDGADREDAAREEAIVSYLYGEASPDERAVFGAHLAECARCRAEVSAFEGVRTSLGQWSPPEPAGLVGNHPSADAGWGAWWRDTPVWAQAVAAVLVVGVAAGMAHLEVRYDASGLRVRTGWAASELAQGGPSVGGASRPVDAPSRAELTALEERLQSQLRQAGRLAVAPAAAPARQATPATAGSALGDAAPDMLRRVRALVEESEQRQQRELALRLAEAMRDINTQRSADLSKIDRSIGAMQNSAGLEILRTRETINDINNYIVRTSSQRPQ